MKKFKVAREIKIGLVTIVTIIAFVIGFNYLKGSSIFNKQRTFFVVYKSVSGLMNSNAVTTSGLPIGQVNKIYFRNNTASEVIVEITITNDVIIPDNSVARIYSSDLLGTKSIEIIRGNSPAAAQSGDTLTSDTQLSLQEEVSDMVQPIMRKAGDMMSSIDTVLTAVGDVFNLKTRENLIRSVESLRQTIGNIEGATHSLDTLLDSQKTRLSRIINNAESITFNLRQNNEDLTKIISNFALISDTLAQSNLSSTMGNLNSTITDLSLITDKIKNGEGSLGMLVNDEKLYNELEASSTQLNLLLEDIRLNPKRYVHFSVFGRSGKNSVVIETDTVVR